MSPMPTLTRGAAKPAPTPTYAYAGKILRVNLSTGKTSTETWSEADRREYLGGIGLGANVLVGGLDKSIALQPVSVEGSTGLNVAAGIGSISLKHVR